MQLRVFDEKKRKQYRFKENEGLQFAFDIETDNAEEVVQQMIEQQHIPDEDTRMITKLIKDKACLSWRFSSFLILNRGGKKTCGRTLLSLFSVSISRYFSFLFILFCI